MAEVNTLIQIRQMRKASEQSIKPRQQTETEKLHTKLNKKKEAYLKECKNAEFLINTVLSRVGAYMGRA